MKRLAVLMLSVVPTLALAQPAPPLPPSQSPAAASATDPKAEKLICKRESVVGSLIASKKKCYTRAEWDRIADAAREGARDLMDRNMSRNGGL